MLRVGYALQSIQGQSTANPYRTEAQYRQTKAGHENISHNMFFTSSPHIVRRIFVLVFHKTHFILFSYLCSGMTRHMRRSWTNNNLSLGAVILGRASTDAPECRAPVPALKATMLAR